MAITEVDALMKYKDNSGNTTVLYPITKADNVDGLDEAIDAKVVNLEPAPVTTSGTGAAYTASVSSVTALSAGVSFVMIPHVESASTSPTLDVNGLGAVRIRRRVSSNTTTTSGGASDSWLATGKPIRVTYDGTFWIADLPKPYAPDLMGVVSIENGGTGANNGAEGIANLLAAGNMVLSEYQYGTDLPDAGTPGRIFFLLM